MTTRQASFANAVAPHSGPEQFQDYAFGELAAAMPSTRGICFLPECSRSFNPTRDWQSHCCKDCAQKTKAEMRKWGHKMALALLVHRIGKYEQCDEAVKTRTKAARRYVSHVQSAWLQDRQRRADAARARHAA